MPSITVIVVSWNVRSYLSACLDSIADACGQTGAEVIVVDNASSDGTAQMVREQYPSVHLIANDANVGFCRANNMALARARGDVLLLLNPDTIAEPGSIAAMEQYLRDHPDVGIVGPALPDPSGAEHLNGWLLPSVWRELVGVTGLGPLFPGAFTRARYGRRTFDTQADVDVVCGACLMMRHQVYRQVGGLDERLVMFFDEIDLCRRAREAGWRVVFLPNAVVGHHVGMSTSQDILRSMVRLNRSRFLYFRKYHGAHAAAMLWLAAWVGAAPHFARALAVRARQRLRGAAR